MFGTFPKRIVLFVATNLAVVLLVGVLLRLLGLEQLLLESSGGSLRLEGLLLFAGVLGFSGALISLFLSKWIALASTGAELISRPGNRTEAWLVETVARQAERAGIGMPDVAIYGSPDPNAFATGASRNNALVAVSTGLLERMDQREVEAVLAHEVSHVANGDMITLSLMQGVVNTFVIFLSRLVGAVVDSLLSRGRDDGRVYGPGPGYWLTVIVCELAFGVLATAIVMWFSRRREFAADYGAAQLEGAEAMIAALQALRRETEPAELPPALAAFGIRSGPPHGLARLFMSHPPLEERIEALARLAAAEPG